MRSMLCPAGVQSQGDCVWVHKGLCAPRDDGQVGMGHPEQGFLQNPPTPSISFQGKQVKQQVLVRTGPSRLPGRERVKKAEH